MFYCPTGDWGCPYYIVDCGGCLLDNPMIDCDDYAMSVEEDEDEIMGVVDMFALNP